MSESRPPTNSQAFPKSSRLLKHADFDRVYKTGRRLTSPNMLVFWTEGATPSSRLGFTVGRTLGGAVLRNRIKRRMREAVRKQKSLLTSAVDVVINPRKTVANIDFAQLETEVVAALKQIAQGKGAKPKPR